MLSVFMLSCRDYLNVMLSVVMLNVVRLSVVRLNVVMLSVEASARVFGPGLDHLKVSSVGCLASHNRLV
jgi:hypothetical protein